MQAFSKYNKGVKYLLTVVDIFSKYGWMIPLKNKTGTEVASALQKVFKEWKPEKLWVDKGKEFYNKHVKQLVDLYSTENKEKSSVVERWNRTTKGKMFKYFTANSMSKYINILDESVNRYNNTVHSTIQMTLTEASKKKTKPKSGKIYTAITVLPSERRQHFQLIIKSESPKRNLFSISGTQSTHHVGLKKLLQLQKFGSHNVQVKRFYRWKDKE